MHTRADTPVFVDHSGRRRRIVVSLGAAAGVVLILAAVVLVLGLTGAGPSRMPGWPEGAPGRASPTPATAGQNAPTASNRPTAVSGSRPPGQGAAGSAVPTVRPSTATTHGNGNGNQPTHTPTAHPSKGH